jgi:pimeloyl-ACP methyl ester carboxylesterase
MLAGRRQAGDRVESGYPSRMPDPMPTYRVRSADGTSIAVFRSGEGPPLVLVHGTSADHTTFRVVGPLLARHLTLHAIDRRGRGASSDTQPYAIARAFEDVAAVVEAVAIETAGPVAVFGHSYGGRTALGAALLTDRIARVICYEGAPTPSGVTYHPAGLDRDLQAHLAAGDPAALLSTFMARVVGMSDAELAAYRADPVWPLRVAAAPTIVRELDAELDPTASLEALGRVRQPVLQLLGGASLPAFREATVALDRRLADGRIVEMAGARHAAHHTHPDAVVAAVLEFEARDAAPMRD